MNDANNTHPEEPGAPTQHDTYEEDPRDVAHLREAIRRLDPLNLPTPRGKTERRRTPGYRTRSLLGASLLLLVVVFALDTDKQLPVIELGTGSAARESNAASDKMLAGAPALSAIWMPNLVLAEGVDMPAGDGEVYQLDQLDDSRIERFAAVLADGLDLEQVPADEGGGLRNTITDGTAGFTMSRNGAWWYSSAMTAVSCAAVTPEPRPATPESGSTNILEPGAVSQGAGCAVIRRTLPSDAEALRAVGDIVDELQLGSGDTSIEYRDDWSLTVRWDPRIPNVHFGETNPFSIRFGLGENGVLEYAGGQLGLLKRVGTYPTVSASDALDTLNRAHTPLTEPESIVGCPEPLARPTADTAAGGAVEDQATSGSSGGGDNVPAVAPSERTISPCGQPVSTTLLVTSVVAVHTLIWDLSGSGWLVPAYEYKTSDGGTWVAVALPEKYLDRQMASEGQPRPTDDGADKGDGAVTSTDSMSVGGSGSALTAGWPGVDALVGVKTADAERIVAAAGLISRVVTEDETPRPANKDARDDRVNLVVEDDTVTYAWLG